MKNKMHYSILRIASLLAPVDQRAEWLTEWHSELWYIPRRGATVFCLGAFCDALWMRRNNLSEARRAGIHLESPLSCLAFLAAVAALGLSLVVWLPAPHLMRHPYLKAGDLPAGCLAMLILSCGFVAAIRVVMGRAAANPHPVPWPGRLRLGIFLVLKIVMVQPVILCGFIVLLLIGPVVPFAPQLGIIASWILTIRWVFTDQQRRCPVCLRLITDPVRIGTPSQTFLEWYGAESMCPRGHGLLHTSETSASHAATPQWLRLGDSWSGVFPQAVGGRRI